MKDNAGPGWGIVGGGMLGLVLALRLSQAGHRVTVLEAAPELGGLASVWQVGDVTWDRYYHVTMLSDSHLRELLRELGLESEIRWQVTRTNFYTGSSIHSLNNVIDYLRLPVLGWLDKFRLAATILYASRIENGQYLERFPVAEWLTRLSGRRTYENLWRPLLRSKLGDNHRHASAAYIWSVIRRFYAARRGGMKTEMFGYVPGGYRSVLEALKGKLEAEGVEIKTGAAVRQIEQVDGELRVREEAVEHRFERVISTCASPIVARLCSGLSEAEKDKHNDILYQGIICASLLLKKPPGDAYLTYITDTEIPFTTVIEMSSLIDADQTGGRYLIYLPRYLPVDDPLFEASDNEIEALFTRGLLRMYPALCAGDIQAFRISRTRHVMAISTRDYSSRLPPLTTSVPGLFVVNSAQIVNGSLSVDETVRLAGEAARTLRERVSPA